MIEIKSLKRITEADEHDKRYDTDVAAANAKYDKVDPTGPLSLHRRIRYMFARNKERAGAAADRTADIDAATARRKAGKLGMVSKQDHDETKFQAAKASTALRSKANAAVGDHSSEPDKPGIIKRVVGAVADHPYLAAGAAAGIAGAAMLQKRKNRLPEPGSYNQGA